MHLDEFRQRDVRNLSRGLSCSWVLGNAGIMELIQSAQGVAVTLPFGIRITSLQIKHFRMKWLTANGTRGAAAECPRPEKEDFGLILGLLTTGRVSFVSEGGASELALSAFCVSLKVGSSFPRRISGGKLLHHHKPPFSETHCPCMPLKFPFICVLFIYFLKNCRNCQN